VVNPKNGRIWTANARIVSGQLLKKVGVNNYALGPRQKQIRDAMLAIDTFNEQDFLDIQLDDRALFLQRWHVRLLTLVTTQENKYPDVMEVLKNWQGRASHTSAGYLLVKRFRENVVDQTAGEIYRYLENNSNEFWPSAIDNFVEYPVWQLITEQPSQHVPAGFDSWDEFLLGMLDKTISGL
jgi:penicillin amidase